MIPLNDAPMRTFTSPGGREWTATIAFAVVLDGAALAPVLRFTSESLVLDLDVWPADWDRLPHAALGELVRAARPPRPGVRRDRSALPVPAVG